MLWTAEAVEVLKRLALEGRSASVIAAALGAASRNAVIGKASRIGVRLNGDGRASAPGGMPAGVSCLQSAAVARLRAAPGGQQKSAAAVFRPPARRAAWSFAEAEVGEMRRARLEEIQELACRWPLGDPMSHDFAYCGLKTAKGRSYCAGHCRMAYQPPNAGARRMPHDQRDSCGGTWRLR